jgi:hypothetical protein
MKIRFQINDIYYSSKIRINLLSSIKLFRQSEIIDNKEIPPLYRREMNLNSAKSNITKIFKKLNIYYQLHLLLAYR